MWCCRLCQFTHIVASSNMLSPLNNTPCDHGLKPETDAIREKLKPMQLVDDTLLVTTVFMSREDLYHAVDAQLPNDRLICQGALMFIIAATRHRGLHLQHPVHDCRCARSAQGVTRHPFILFREQVQMETSADSCEWIPHVCRLTVLLFDADHPTERHSPVPRGSDAKNPDDDCTLSLKSQVSLIDVLLLEIQGSAGSCVIATECVHACLLWTALDHDHCACQCFRSSPANSQRPTKLGQFGLCFCQQWGARHLTS